MLTFKKKIYLANPMGFSLQQKEVLLPQIVGQLEGLELDVVEPFARQIDMSQEGWAHTVAQDCINDVKSCDAIFAIVNGTPPDEGVMVELGIAMALNKEVFLFRDDFRRCTDSEEYPLNLMIFAALPKVGWEESYYTSVEEIVSPAKKLSSWAKVKISKDSLKVLV